jgi:CheY-like chemotaxis protein
MPNRNWRLLVVEDDVDGQEVMSTILSHQQILFDVAGDASEAERLLFSSPSSYNAIIIDLALPGKDGWELLRDIQGNNGTYSTPCIAVTAYHNSKMREDALNAGFVAYFSKPIDATAFGRALQTLL